MNSQRGARITFGAVLITVSLFQFDSLIGQGPGGPGGRGFSGQPPVNLPTSPTAVALPTISAEVTGPGPVFD